MSPSLTESAPPLLSKVRMVLLGSSFATGSNGEACGLANVYGSQAINYIMAAIKCMPRLQPMSEKVAVITNGNNYDAYCQWASSPQSCLYGAPAVGNIISNGTNNGATASPLTDILLATESAGFAGCSLVIISLEYLLDPYINLQKLVEHSIIRGKDTVMFSKPPPGQNLQPFTMVELDAAGGANPRVIGVGGVSGEADGLSHSVLSPMVVLKKDSIPEISKLVGNEVITGMPPSRQIGALIGTLVAAGKPMYGLELDLFLNLDGPENVAYADAFAAYCADTKISAPPNEAANKIHASMTAVTNAGIEMNVLSLGEENIESLLKNCSEVKLAYLYFFAAGGDTAKLGVVDASAGTRALPDRFANMGTMRHSAKKEHPIYQTTNNDYGLKKALQAHAPEVQHQGQHHANSLHILQGPQGAR
eukprot:gene15926-22059_t